MTDRPTFMPEPLDGAGAHAIPPVWDPEDWPEMASGTPTDTAAPDTTDTAAPDTADTAAPDTADAAAPGTADAAAPDTADAYVPFADRVPEAPLPVAAGHEDFSNAAPTAHDNHLGTYALFFGVVGFCASAALILWGAGLWWLDVVIGGAGAYYGVRGFNAASRGRATNRSTAVAGGVMGLVAAIAAAAYLVVVALAFTNAFRQS